MRNRNFPNIAHLGYIVPDLRKNAEVFSVLHGITEFIYYDFKPIRAWSNGKEIFDCRFEIAMGTAGSTKIELIRPISGDTPQMEFLRKTGGGIHHFSFQVDDFEEWKSYLENNPLVRNLFEAEVYDEVRGYRRCIYAQLSGSCPIVEFAEVPRAFRP
jgi:hypothetical protein